LSKTIVLLPIFNEAYTLADIVKRVRRQADLLVCVNDASQDASLKILRSLAHGRRDLYIVDLPQNRGMAGALKAGFHFILALQAKGQVGEDDVVVMLDADGQHEPEHIPGALEHMRRGGFDMVLLKRDISIYPRYKHWGNWFLSLVNSILAGHRYHDVECGYRFLKVRFLPGILRYYAGVHYSCAQEIAFLSARQGLKVDNTYPIRIPFYRQGASFQDGFIVLWFSLVTFFRWLFRIPVPPEDFTELMEKSWRESRGTSKK